MARQTGIIKLKGKIGDVSFYKTKDGHLAREKGGVEADRIKNDPAFARTRENGAEFGASATSGKLTRDSLRPIARTAADNRVVSRMTKLMSQIKNLDATSIRGQRKVGVAIANATAKALLKGFEFNKNALLGSILYKPYTVVPTTGVISIPGLIPVNDVAFPVGATHISFTGCYANLNYATALVDVKLTNVVNVPIDAATTAVLLTPTAVPTGTGTKIYLLRVEFFQLMNGVQYSLKNGAYNALRIIEVA
ncbi:MAG: hypothetical protein E6Q37_00150 [Crocinitomicaceae bacterium]|nr:MAG: hypothetical protein E6Q37_00150 [Crocinitomicaceae bacterium]